MENNNKQMTPKEALQLLAQVAAMYKGNLQEHTALQEALKVLNETLPSEEPDQEDKKE